MTTEAMDSEFFSDAIIDREAPVLVTGATGFIGKRVVQSLLTAGFRNVRCLVRSVAKETDLLGVSRNQTGSQPQIVRGNLLSRDDCVAAARGITVIYHLAASTGEKSFPDAFMNSALATRNLVEAFLQNGSPRRFVNVSSFAVYSNLGLRRGAVLDETCPLEDSPQQRFDPYAFGKLKQEEIVRKYGTEQKLPYVIVRPGTVFGPGKQSLTGRIGIDTFGFFMHLGGSNQLPLTFVDNCADAIVLAGLKRGVDGEVFNIVDDEPITSREFLTAHKKAVGNYFSVPVPYPVAYLSSLAWENYAKWSKGQLPPVFNQRRCAAEWKGNRFPNTKIRKRLGWRPRVPMNKALEAFLAQFATRRITT